MAIQTTNPATGELVKDFHELGESEIIAKVDLAAEKYEEWRKVGLAERIELLRNMADVLDKNSRKYAEIITLEMGKAISEAEAEVKKCALVCRYYADNATEFLKPEVVETDSAKSYVRFDPIGVVLAVMPWNFPFWQVLRFAAPALTAGNTALLKHASNVPQSSLAIEEAFLEAGYPEGVFQSLLIGSSKVEKLIKNPNIKAVTLTGSEYAGSQVGMTAGAEIKKSVLELGGSDPFIVLADADIEEAVAGAIKGRLLNNGQSCIAAKRFIVASSIAEEFTSALIDKVKELKIGDPSKDETEIGPMVNEQSLNEIKSQIDEAVSKGAILAYGGDKPEDLAPENQSGYFITPAVLTNVDTESTVFREETFGPIFAISIATSAEEALEMANDSELALGASIWTKDTNLAEKLAAELDSGSVFINSIVRSDPRLPFGGEKKSGYGRELSHYGLREFVNIKTVVVEK